MDLNDCKNIPAAAWQKLHRGCWPKLQRAIFSGCLGGRAACNHRLSGGVCAICETPTFVEVSFSFFVTMTAMRCLGLIMSCRGMPSTPKSLEDRRESIAT